MATTYPDALASALAVLCETYLGRPATFATDADTGLPVLTFDPPLSTDEQTTYDDLLAMARSKITGLSLTEYQALKPTLVGLRAYRNLGSPTNAQSVAAIKGIIDVLRAILTD